jgi:hypothetical protein
MLIITSIILFIALFLSWVTITDFIYTYGNKRTYYPLSAVITCVIWSLFYYLTHL